NTKGRKSSTHLIMDAWIKGVRSLTVVYYNYIQPEVAWELLESAAIMDIEVRIGIEFSARFRGRFVKLIWTPSGFADNQDFLAFLHKPEVSAFLAESRKVSTYQQKYVFSVLAEYNERHRPAMARRYGLDLEPLDEASFRAFVGAGQPSLLHLGKYIHNSLFSAMQSRLEDLRTMYGQGGEQERAEIRKLVQDMNRLDSDFIIDEYLLPAHNPHLPDPAVPRDGDDVPELLTLGPRALLTRIKGFRSGPKVTLYLSGLGEEDVLELLYDCQGMITDLEVFNLKNYVRDPSTFDPNLVKLQRDINSGNIIRIKRYVRRLIQKVDREAGPEAADRVLKFKEILRNISPLLAFYRESPIRARIGSGSTGGSSRTHGMGLAVKGSIPARGLRGIEDDRNNGSRFCLPVSADAHLRTSFLPQENGGGLISLLTHLAGAFPVLGRLGGPVRRDWVGRGYSAHLRDCGNIITLGGRPAQVEERLCLEPSECGYEAPRFSLKRLHSVLRNSLKVLVGFMPAFLTFFLTKDWWLLAYFGAVIWFAITGLRNIIQSVLGGGGLRRSPLLRWNDYVSWERLCDSLFWTGFSVPLLDYLVKALALDRGLDVNTTTNPVLLYTVMALANGLYIFSHNILRGLPRSAALGNIFRSVLSIPLAVAFNWAAGGLLGVCGVLGVNLVLQKWAAVISKLASDCVAGFIEGLADRAHNMRMRWWDYNSKLFQLFGTYSRLESLFPETDLLELLASPVESVGGPLEEGRDLEKVIMVHVLDLLYFWMYQPQARTVLRRVLKSMPQEERQILVISQLILQREREISQLFVDGIVGKNFSRALAFYLNRCGEYMDAIQLLAHKYWALTGSEEVVVGWTEGQDQVYGGGRAQKPFM
ncbi:MAG: hypothetical protein PHV85_08080, partial [Desulfovibrionaceae bacterium]|nr:hypothetical protein [Desulfovibrionaceae bacterium]